MDRHVYKRSAEDECLQQSAVTAVHKTGKEKNAAFMFTWKELKETHRPFALQEANTPLLSLLL